MPTVSKNGFQGSNGCFLVRAKCFNNFIGCRTHTTTEYFEAIWMRGADSTDGPSTLEHEGTEQQQKNQSKNSVNGHKIEIGK